MADEDQRAARGTHVTGADRREAECGETCAGDRRCGAPRASAGYLNWGPCQLWRWGVVVVDGGLVGSAGARAYLVRDRVVGDVMVDRSVRWSDSGRSVLWYSRRYGGPGGGALAACGSAARPSTPA